MKKTFFTCLALLTLHLSVSAQTTQEEFNYVTKGWKNHLEDGSDVKKGYQMNYRTSAEIKTTDGHLRKADLYTFTKTDGNRLVAYMVTYQLDDNQKEYICIPHTKSTQAIQKQYLASLHDFKSDNSLRLLTILSLMNKIVF